MSIVSSQSEVVKELIAAGIIPPRCRRWELICEPMKAVCIRSEVFVTEEEFRIIADALVKSRGALKQETLVRSLVRGETSEAIGPIESTEGAPAGLYAEKL